jgi:hypothetical protein
VQIREAGPTTRRGHHKLLDHCLYRPSRTRLEISSGFHIRLAGDERESILMTGSEQRQIDEGSRPDRYFGPTDLESHLLSTIKGAERRNLVASRLRNDNGSFADGLAEPSLPDDVRASWGAIHPAMLGGEYLPDRRTAEREIARITIQSTTQDVVCVYASPGRDRIRYRVVDEYGGDCLEGRIKRTSSRPLSLGDLTDFFLGAWDLVRVLERNFPIGASSLGETLKFFKGESAFYPDFDPALRARVKAWRASREVTR